jgi:hypothetical protein
MTVVPDQKRSPELDSSDKRLRNGRPDRRLGVEGSIVLTLRGPGNGYGWRGSLAV